VRHAGRGIEYDWDTPKEVPVLQWAAFYSDCEHEICEVIEGHRVTLTYNLYYRPKIPDVIDKLGDHPAPVDITKLPLYEVVQSVLKNEQFMGDGMSPKNIKKTSLGFESRKSPELTFPCRRRSGHLLRPRLPVQDLMLNRRAPR
jgi:hypothetical protein